MKHKVLALLEENSNLPLEDIAVELGLNLEEVADIIQKAESDGTIKRYKAVIDWEQLQ